MCCADLFGAKDPKTSLCLKPMHSAKRIEQRLRRFLQNTIPKEHQQAESGTSGSASYSGQNTKFSGYEPLNLHRKSSKSPEEGKQRRPFVYSENHGFSNRWKRGKKKVRVFAKSSIGSNLFFYQIISDLAIRQ